MFPDKPMREKRHGGYGTLGGKHALQVRNRDNSRLWSKRFEGVSAAAALFRDFHKHITELGARFVTGARRLAFAAAAAGLAALAPAPHLRGAFVRMNSL